MQNIYHGSRCFIVGNGPSLSSTDLDKLKGEICFATNRIYEIFDETEWRPIYYLVQDRKLIDLIKHEIIEQIDIDNKYVGIDIFSDDLNVKNIKYLNVVSKPFYPKLPKFSSDASKKCYNGWTITYTCIQLAAYMGFGKIYLIGVDHNYSKTLNSDGTVTSQNIQDHFSTKDQILNTPALYKSTLSYEAAKQYADAHGIKIYNATRGGKLEVFERVDFDSLFDKEIDK